MPNGLASAECRGPAAGAFGLTIRLLEKEVVFSFFFIYLFFLFLFVPSTVRPLQAGRFFPRCWRVLANSERSERVYD